MVEKRTGFTIVELLIVIVVIAILATITIVSYNGIQTRAKDSAHRQEISQVESAIMVQSTLEATSDTGIAGELIGFAERTSTVNHNEVKLIRPVVGTPDLTMYFACSDTTTINIDFTSSVFLAPHSSSNSIRFQSRPSGDSGMGIRMDTSAQSNVVSYVTGIRSVGADYIGWLQVTNSGKTITYNYNNAASGPVMTLSAHTGWNLDTFVVGGQASCVKTIGMLFDIAHDAATRQSAMNWMKSRLQLSF